jgi:hypothetical protein
MLKRFAAAKTPFVRYFCAVIFFRKMTPSVYLLILG